MSLQEERTQRRACRGWLERMKVLSAGAMSLAHSAKQAPGMFSPASLALAASTCEWSLLPASNLGLICASCGFMLQPSWRDLNMFPVPLEILKRQYQERASPAPQTFQVPDPVCSRLPKSPASLWGLSLPCPGPC